MRARYSSFSRAAQPSRSRGPDTVRSSGNSATARRAASSAISPAPEAAHFGQKRK